MIKIRSLLKEDDFDLSDNPLSGKSYGIVMDLGRTFSVMDVVRYENKADVVAKQLLNEEIGNRVASMHEEIDELVEEGMDSDEFDPEWFDGMGDNLSLTRVGEDFYYVQTGEESAEFILGFQAFKELEGYVKYNTTSDDFEILDHDGLDEYLESLVDIGGDSLDSAYTDYFVEEAGDYFDSIIENNEDD